MHFRKAFLVENSITFDERLPFGEDTLFNVDLFLSKGSILEVHECFMIYRRRPNSAMTKPIEKMRLRSQYQLIQKLVDRLDFIGDFALRNAVEAVINMNSQHLVQSVGASPDLKDECYDLLTDEIKQFAAKSPLSFA